MIRLGTLFSGIGAIEQALLRMGEEHVNVFACDNGEIELKLLDNNLQHEYDVLKKVPRYRISDEQKHRLEELVELEQQEIERIAAVVAALPSIEAKQAFVDDLYQNHSKGINLVKQSYLANYAIGQHDFHLDVHFMDGRDYYNQVDLMVGGSPCQSFSTNGKRGGFADTRGTLFHEYARIISEVQPKCFIFENVKGLLLHDKGTTWATIRNTFQELNYNIYLNHDENGNEQPLLNARHYGIPQNRERIFLVGIRNDIVLKNPFTFPERLELQTTNADYLDQYVPA